MPGPLILDLIGPELSVEETELLTHPTIGGVILFSRNYQSPTQLADLCAAIRQTREAPLLITVDHEGGRVQRFRSGFTRLPSMEQVGAVFDDTRTVGLQLAEVCGELMATELLCNGVDLSYAPVLDLNKNISTVIGDRAFHRDPSVVAELALALARGMRKAGMASVGKHFPGHGSVQADSHLALPVDERPLPDVEEDLLPFVELIREGIPALMPAHILFPAVHDKPVGFSSVWLRDILRQQLHFNGVIFSDDLNMDGAKIGGDPIERAGLALEAGCDMILICNNRPAAVQILDQCKHPKTISDEKFKMLQGRTNVTSYSSLLQSAAWQAQLNFLIDNVECTLT